MEHTAIIVVVVVVVVVILVVDDKSRGVVDAQEKEQKRLNGKII